MVPIGAAASNHPCGTSAIATALRRVAAWRADRKLKAETEARLATLTPREREVLKHVMNGRLNKQIAADLGTAEKTVKVHRARGLDKMQVRSVAELVRVVERVRGAGHLPPGTREFDRCRRARKGRTAASSVVPVQALATAISGEPRTDRDPWEGEARTGWV